MTCVVLVGMPMAEAPRMTPAEAVSTQKPCTGWSLTKSWPTVLMIRQPPAAVPSAMAVAQAIMTPRAHKAGYRPVADQRHGDDPHGFLGVGGAVGEGHESGGDDLQPAEVLIKPGRGLIAEPR